MVSRRSNTSCRKRNKIHFFLLAATLASIGLPRFASLSWAGPPEERDWEPIQELSDEFNISTLDRGQWDDHNPRWGGRPPGYFSKANVQVRDGYLTLRAREETLPNALLPYRDFTTAAVKSKHKVLYGYFEVRARPMRSRIGSGFWFYDQEPDHWTEIDVFEIGAGAPGHERAYHTNAHVFHTPEYRGTVKEHMRNPSTIQVSWVLSEEFHVYGLEWDEKEIKWYIDDQLVRTLPNAYWHYPLYMNLDTETLPNWFGLPDKGELPTEYIIDYVRSWKQVP